VVAWVIIRVSAESFGADDDFEIRLGLKSSSLFSGVVIGFAITQLTVAVTAARIVRINIVLALKDAVEQRLTTHSWVRVVLWLTLTVVGLAAWLVASDNQPIAFGAPLLAAIGIVPFLARLVG